MKKILTLLLCVTMVMSMLVVPASAAYNFNDGTGNVSFGAYSANVNDYTLYLTESGYKGGIAGKAETDKSLYYEFKDVDTTTVALLKPGSPFSGFFSAFNGKSKTNLMTNHRFDYDVYVEGDVVVRIQTTNTVKDYDITSAVCNGRWVHVTAWAYNNKWNVYIDGVNVVSGSQADLYRHRIVILCGKNSENFNGLFAIDNYSTDYNATTAPVFETVELSSVNNDVKMIDDLICVPENTIVADLSDSISCADYVEYGVYTSDFTKKSDDAVINEGDVIVAYDNTYANNTNMKYIDVVDSETIDAAIEAANLIKYVDFENGEELAIGNAADLAEITHIPGMYGKAADDDALVLVPNGAPTPRLSVSGVKDLNTDAKLCVDDNFEAKEVTVEFSVAINDAYGDFNISIIPQYKPNDVEGWTYVNTYRMNNELFRVIDGKIYASYLTPGYDYDYPAEQWLRVAVTIKPETEKYDLYINGFLARGDGALGGDTNTRWISAAAEDWDGTTNDKWQYIGLNDLRIMGYAASGNVSEIAVDDLKVYYGKYNPKDKISVTGYVVDCDNVFVMDDGVTLTKAMVEGAVNDGCTVEEYGDGFVVTKGFVKRYFTGASKSITVNSGDIKLYDDDGELAEIKAGARIYAEATPEYVGYKPALILAVYKGDELLDLHIANGEGSSFKTDSYYVAEDADVENITVKAMLWDGFENIMPYSGAVTVPAN